MILLAVDPSLRSAGAALFRGGVLVDASPIKCDGTTTLLNGPARARAMSSFIAQWATSREHEYACPDVLALEWPQIYRDVRSNGDRNDLLGLAAVCAAVACRYPNAEVVTYTPAQWEPCPKVSDERKRRKLGPIDSEAFTSPRGQYIMRRLSEVERPCVPKSHDAMDAVGIGLHYLGRLARVKVYPGATRG